MRTLRQHDVMRILRTWCNACATSTRYHHAVTLPCLFGCRARKDSLTHYLQCPHMYALMKFFNSTTDSNPLIRFGLVNPNPERLSLICCSFAGYHAVRRNVRKSSFAPVDMELSYGDLRRFWTLFAEAFAAEAREHCIACAKFSVPEFVNFLVTANGSGSASS